MLKQRLVTAAIMVPLVVAGTLWLPETGFLIVSGLLIFLAAWEWAALCRLRSVPGRFFYIFLLALASSMVFTQLVAIEQRRLLVAVSVCWLASIVLVIIYERRAYTILRYPLLAGFVGLGVLTSAWLSLVLLHRADRAMLVILLITIWLADVGGYFVGRAYGKAKLAPRTSPGKTWQGAIAALALGSLFFAVSSYLSGRDGDALSFSFVHIVGLFACGVVLVYTGILGDLIESLLKRCAGVKDSGVLMPGHGGVLDRLDSLLSSFPVLYVMNTFYL